MGKTFLLLITPAVLLTVSSDARTPLSLYGVRVSPGWNLISLPVDVTDGRRSVLFPTAISPAYVFNPALGYESRDSLQAGVGFWLKFNTADTVDIIGSIVLKDTIECETGWNLIGATSLPVDTASIITDPPGIIASAFFEHHAGGGGQQADTLWPGSGYWVKVRQRGSLILKGPFGQRCADIPTVDYAGKTYSTVQIGNQCWLRENLNIGIMVPGAQNQTNNSTIEKYCYGDNAVNCEAYGGLYQWNEALQYEATKLSGLCPPGWHIPVQEEFQRLVAAVGGDGNALKAIGQGSGGGTGTDASGFSALLGGIRYASGAFGGHETDAFFWGSIQASPTNSFGRHLNHFDGSFMLQDYTKAYGFAVRCLRDDPVNGAPLIPATPAPGSGTEDCPLSLTLSWLCADPDGDLLEYDIYFGRANPPDTLVSVNQTATTHTQTELLAGTTYYWRVLAKDDHGHLSPGPVWMFTTLEAGAPCLGTPTVEYAGKTYHTVQIGTQCWLKENLDVGTMISSSRTQIDNDTIEKYCYGDNAANCATYGGLYQSAEAMQYVTSQMARGICPPGWHVPKLTEFERLAAAVGGNANSLKAIGQGTGSGAGNNETGFSALLAGYSWGNFRDLGEIGGFWSSSLGTWPDLQAYNLCLFKLGPGMTQWGDWRDCGYSVRCLKD
jgi:uncharacterized protein (TIGR02145 family)